jgi:outer membrane protein OmpU
MKYRAIALVLLQVVAARAYGQSSVTMYGSIDNGITYVNNAGGKSNLIEQGGINKSNTFGLTGNEDLGGGIRALFKLENGYSSTTGTLGQGGLLFGKQAYVGLRDVNVGEVTIGRQYDFTVQLQPYAPCIDCGIYAVQNADLDRISGERLNNSVRFSSVNLAGFSFGTMYAFGQNTGALTMNAGRAYSAMAKYGNGPFSAIAVLTDINGAPVSLGQIGARAVLGMPVQATTTMLVDKQRIAALGVSYKIGAWMPSFTYSNTQLKVSGASSTDQLLRIGTTLTPISSIVLSGQLTADRLADSRWYSLYLGFDYLLSTRTDLYVDFAAQRATGPGTVASTFLLGPSSTSSQVVSRIGIKHLF